MDYIKKLQLISKLKKHGATESTIKFLLKILA